jgi:hypothetical protein
MFFRCCINLFLYHLSFNKCYTIRMSKLILNHFIYANIQCIEKYYNILYSLIFRIFYNRIQLIQNQ